MSDWFTINKIDESTHVISEYRHPEETHAYLLNGKEKSLLIDTGLGIANIAEAVTKLTDKPITAVATHIHWDHIGGHQYFSDFCVHEAEKPWIEEEFPLPKALVKKFLQMGDLPKNFDIEHYDIFHGTPKRFLHDGDTIDLGSRTITTLHTPGHSPGHLCFFEEATGYLFAGDLIYSGTLYANYESTDPEKYLASLEKIAKLPIKKLFPAHHSLAITPSLVTRTLDAFCDIKRQEKLHHGGGHFVFDDFAILL